MNKTITFVIPVYNEEKRINTTITALKNVVIPHDLYLEKVIFVNDGSTDNTLKMLNNIKTSLSNILATQVEIVSYKNNKGKGFAIKTGMQHANSDYNMFFDADMSTPLTEINKLVPFMLENKDVVIGTRKNGHSTVIVHQPLHRELMGKVYTFISQLILNTWVTDFTCGFKAFSREATRDIFNRSLINRWGYDSEILFLARKLGYSINEKAVLWSDDKNTKVRLFKAAFTSFSELLKIRTNYLLGKYQLVLHESVFSILRIANN